MADQQNLVNFPESGKERRRILRKSEDPRLRLATILASVSGWLFTLALVLFLVTNYRLLLPDSIQRITSYLAAGLQTTTSDAATIEYASGSMRDAELYGGGLAYVDSDTLYVSKPNGLDQLTMQLSYTDPAVETSDSLVLVYDRGGKGAVLANALSPVCEVKVDSPIISGSIGENGGFVLVTDESGWKTAAAVYTNKGGDPVFKWSSSEYYILSAALSPDGNYLAALAFRQNGVELESELMLWRTDREAETPEASYSLGTALGYEVRFLSSNIAAVMTDHGAFLVNRRGELLGQYEVSNSDLIGYAVVDRGILVVTNAYQGSARAEARLLGADGELSEQAVYISSEIQHLSADGAVFGVLTNDGVMVYDVNTGELMWEDDTVTGARGLKMDSSGTAYVLYGGECRILHP